MAVKGETLVSPEIGWKRYELENGAVKLTSATLATTSGANVSGGQSVSFPSKSSKAEFDFIGTGIIIRVWYGSNSLNGKFTITVDGVPETITMAGAPTSYVVGYVKEGLTEGLHTVVIQSDDIITKWVDTVDIQGEDSQLLHLNEVKNITELSVGKRIRCHYEALPGQVGVFSNLGKETNNLLPSTPTDTPKGDFYLLMVSDVNGDKKLIADRNIQNGISWDNLSIKGLTDLLGLPIELPILNKSKTEKPMVPEPISEPGFSVLRMTVESTDVLKTDSIRVV